MHTSSGPSAILNDLAPANALAKTVSSKLLKNITNQCI